MYNPSRGGVRGGADQFTWESVKTDKHRENYLGHSLKAPVGRWQKGKDLSWYAKERKDENGANSEISELAAIKRAEEEAMLIALGHNIVRKETQMLSKEEMKEALKRNIGDRDELNIERVDGVGATSRRAAMMSGTVKDSRKKNEGVLFESHRGKEASSKESLEISDAVQSKRKKSKKSSKKHKKEKKKHSRHSSDDEDDFKHKAKHKKYSKNESNYEVSLEQRNKKSKLKHKSYSSSSSSENGHLSRSKSQKHKSRTKNDIPVKRQRHDTSESD